MRKLLLGLLIFLTCISQCFAYGVIARGTFGNSSRWTAVTGQPTMADAVSAALQACRELGLTQCETYASLHDVCFSIATSPNNFVDAAEGSTVDEARRNAIATCSVNRRSTCIELATWCDVTPADEPIATPDAPNETGLIFFGPRFIREVEVSVSVSYAAGAIVLVLFLWILVSLISTTSVDVLKHRATLSAWITLPSLPAGAILVFGPSQPAMTTYLLVASVLWTDVYSALAIGSGLRRFLISIDVPAIRSLPLATLVFTAITFAVGKLFSVYGTFPDTSCPNPPYPLLSACGYFTYEGFYAAAFALLLLIVCGAALPPNSNLIRGYDWLNARVRRALVLFGRRQPELTVPERLERPDPRFTLRSNTNERHELEKSAIKKAIRAKREEFDL